MSKVFIRSRALWAAAIPLVVAALAVAGINTENLAEQLAELGTAVGLLVAAVLGLWSRFRPDGAKLTPAGSIVLLLAVWLTLGCASRLAFENPFLVTAVGDAYSIEGKTEVNDEGETVCASDDCIEVRGGNMGDNMATLLKDTIAFAVGFLPSSSDGHTHAVSK